MPQEDEEILTMLCFNLRLRFSFVVQLGLKPLAMVAISVLASVVSRYETSSPTAGWLAAQMSLTPPPAHTHAHAEVSVSRWLNL